MRGQITGVNRLFLLLPVAATLIASPLAAQNGGRNDGGLTPPQFPPKLDPKHPPRPADPHRPQRGDQMSSLIDYLASDDVEFPGEIDDPVTGYANEALWEPVEVERLKKATARR